MLKRALLVAIGAVSIALVLPVFAQQAATITLRSGERISGELVDFGGVGYTIRVGGQDRTINPNDVAAVELNPRPLTAQQQSELSNGHPFVLLNSGEMVSGRLYDIGGTNPLRFLIDTPSGQREFSGNDIAGIYIANPANASNAAPGGAVGTSGVQTATAGSIVVPANQPWTPTNIRVRAGERYNFNVTGVIQYTPDPNERAERQGSLQQHKTAGAPLPNELVGALIGRVENGQPFLIGGQPQVTMPASGMLWVGINDDNVADNAGQFNVTITKQQ